LSVSLAASASDDCCRDAVTFYDNPGIDAESILRATLVNIQNGETSEGYGTVNSCWRAFLSN